jgi:hypothetical protein
LKVKIVFSPPDKNAPGYLRRTRTILAFQEAINSKQVNAQMIDDMVTFLADFVTEPASQNEAIDALWEASEAQLLELFTELGGGEITDIPLSANGSRVGSTANITSPL